MSLLSPLVLDSVSRRPCSCQRSSAASTTSGGASVPQSTRSVSIRDYQTQREFLQVLIEDLVEWFGDLQLVDARKWEEEASAQQSSTTVWQHNRLIDSFFKLIEDGALLCDLSNAIRMHLNTNGVAKSIKPKRNAATGSFYCRDNVSRFIDFCNEELQVKKCIMFETDDLILRKNEKNVVLTLVDVGRIAARRGMTIMPLLIHFERQIDELDASSSSNNLLSPNESVWSYNTAGDGDKEPCSTSSSTGIGFKSESSNVESTSSSGCEDVPSVSPPAPHVDDDSSAVASCGTSGSSGSAAGSDDSAFHTRLRLSRPSRLRPPKMAFSGRLPSPIATANQQHNPNQQQQVQYVTQMSESEIAAAHKKAENSRLTWQHRLEEQFKSLNELIREALSECRCPQRFRLTRCADASDRYRVGEGDTIVFIRVLRRHVMVRVGGGWDTLASFLDRHDPCRQLHHSLSPPTPSTTSCATSSFPQQPAATSTPRRHTNDVTQLQQLRLSRLPPPVAIKLPWCGRTTVSASPQFQRQIPRRQSARSCHTTPLLERKALASNGGRRPAADNELNRFATSTTTSGSKIPVLNYGRAARLSMRSTATIKSSDPRVQSTKNSNKQDVDQENTIPFDVNEANFELIEQYLLHVDT